MNKATKTLGMLAAVGSLFLAAPQGWAEMNVGVLDFWNASNTKPGANIGKELAAIIAKHLGSLPGITVIKESQIKGAMERGLLKDALLAEEGALAAGASGLREVQLIVLGGLADEEEGLTLRGRVIDVASGTIVGAGKVSGKDYKALAAALARQLGETISSLQPSAQPSAAPPKAPSEGEQETTVEGEGRAPLKGNEQAAARVALILARRDAVERGVGAQVDLSRVPNRRAILTKVEGTLQSEVVSEGKSGDSYVVKVRGKVKIPADLIAQYPKSPEAPALTTGLAPLVQETPFGTINWEEGFLTAIGSGKYPKGKSGEQARLMAREAGKQEAYAHAMEMVAAMRVTAESRARDLLKDETIAVRVKGLIQGAMIVEEKDEQEKASYRVTLRVPLVGMKGINVVLLEASETVPASPLPKQALEETIPEDAETGLVIDARGTSSKPAIVPEIVTEDGEVIYNPKDSDPAALAAIGSASYAIGEKPADQSGESEAIDEGASIPDGVTFVSAYGGNNEEESTLAKAKSKAGKKKKAALRKRKLRQGQRPLRIKAASSAGSLQSTIVVSKADGEAIKAANQRGRFLKACKVVIVTDSMIGGVEGRLRGVQIARNP